MLGGFDHAISFLMHLRRHLQALRVEPYEACRVVLVAGFGQVGFHRGAHWKWFTAFSVLWQPAFEPARPENQFAVSVVRVLAATAVDREFASTVEAHPQSPLRVRRVARSTSFPSRPVVARVPSCRPAVRASARTRAPRTHSFARLPDC